MTDRILNGVGDFRVVKVNWGVFGQRMSCAIVYIIPDRILNDVGDFGEVKMNWGGF